MKEYPQWPLSSVAISENAPSSSSLLLRRHLNAWDLLLIGVGSTLGGGVFCLTGLVATQYAGPASFVSWILAGLAALTSGCCFAELGGASLPTDFCPAGGSGSTFAYVRLCYPNNDILAILAAACLTLEYTLSAAAIARSWSNKLILHVAQRLDNNHVTLEQVQDVLTPHNVPIPAMLLCLASMFLFLRGVHESKVVTNTFTIVKLILIAFVICAGLGLFQPQNMTRPDGFAPYGVRGILRGSLTSFFGFIGYDEICVLTGEALAPQRDVPLAVLGTVGIVTVVMVLASIALVGLQPYGDLDATDGFPLALQARGWMWAAELTAVGEIIVLPVSVFLGFLAQPRLFLACSQDGLLPMRIFGPSHSHSPPNSDNITENAETTVSAKNGVTQSEEEDNMANLKGGLWVTGTVMTLSCLFEITFLSDLCSAGILVAFFITNTCLILLRCEPRRTYVSSNSNTSEVGESVHHSEATQLIYAATNDDAKVEGFVPTRVVRCATLECEGNKLKAFLFLYNTLCFLMSMYWAHPVGSVRQQQWVGLVSAVILLWFPWRISRKWPSTNRFGGVIFNDEGCNVNILSFRTPFVPYLPCLGMVINWFLVAQLELWGITLLVLYLALTAILYILWRHDDAWPWSTFLLLRRSTASFSHSCSSVEDEHEQLT